MARVAILSRTYYPVETPNTFRVASFARWFPEFGFSVRVAAPEWNRESTRFIPYFASALADAVPDERKEEIVYFPASAHMYCDWNGKYRALQPLPGNRKLIRQMVSVGRQLYQREPFDVILASAPPVSMMWAANQLSRELCVPWVVDLRDILGQIPENRDAGIRGTAEFLVRKLTGVRQRWIAAQTMLCNRAFAAATVSDSLAGILRIRGVRRVEVIFNGYEEEEFEKPPINRPKFTVQYFGTFYPYCEVTSLFDALDELLMKGKIKTADFEVVFRGLWAGKPIEQQLQSRPCRQIVHAKKRISKSEAVARMKGSQVLLHLSIPNTKGIFTSKLSEYLGAGTPILSVPGDGDVVDRFLRDTGAGVSLGDPGAIAEYLLAHYQAWERGETIAHSVDPALKEFYTRRKQAEKMARLLDEAIASNQGR